MSVPFEVKRVEWSINRERFARPSEEDDFEVGSPSFSIGLDNTKSSWSLCLRRLEDTDQDGFQYSLNLQPAYGNPSSVDIKFKVGVITRDGREDNVKQCQIFSGKDAWGYPAFLGEYVRYKDSFFKEDKLTIFCDLEMGKKAREAEVEFSRIFDSGEFADFTLVVGKEELKVHRMMLAAKSPVFEKMFKHDTKDKRDGRVEIKDLDIAGIKGLLQFIYSGDVKDLEEIAVNVLPAADKYGVDELKTLCEKAICNQFTTKNVPTFLVLADQYCAEYLRAEALEFIKKNSVEVEEEPGFHEEFAQENPKIYKEIVKSFAACAKRANECKCDASNRPPEKRIKLN